MLLSVANPGFGVPGSRARHVALLESCSGVIDGDGDDRSLRTRADKLHLQQVNRMAPSAAEAALLI